MFHIKLHKTVVQAAIFLSILIKLCFAVSRHTDGVQYNSTSFQIMQSYYLEEKDIEKIYSTVKHTPNSSLQLYTKDVVKLGV